MPETRTQRPRSRLVLAAAALAAVVLVSACSMVRMGYSQLDSFAAWMVDEYFDLDQRQKDQFLARFDQLYEWHRYVELPDYAAFLEDGRRRLQRGLAREDVEWVVEGFRLRYRRIAERGAGDAAALLATLTPAQIQVLQRQWVRDNARFVRDNALDRSAEERRRAQVRRTVDRIRDWTGTLTREQEARIGALVQAMPEIARLRHEDRLRRQREFLALLELRGNRAAFDARLRDWLVNWEAGRAPELERRYRQGIDMRVDMVVSIDRMLTPQQRANAAARLQRYADDFRSLAERSGARTAAH